MINSDSLLLTSGVILTILISATVINYTSKFILVSEKLKKLSNQMYDPDHGLNISNVCVLSKNAYAMPFEKSVCYNKTLMQWYNPWLRHNLWTEFWNEIRIRNRLKRMRMLKTANNTETPVRNETVVLTDVPKKKYPEVPKEKEKPIEFVYSTLVGLLVISGVLACWEVCKDKLKKDEGAAKAQERECSLADFTMNRHLRRESQQQTFSHLPRQGSLELTAKVTQNLIHQSSLDRALPKTISEAIISQESRRNSMPLYLSSDAPVVTSSTSMLKSVKKHSVDIAGEDIGAELRKKPRHFIRRH